MEIWKPVVGFESEYHVSSLGRIKSFVRNRNGRIRSTKCATNTYIRISLRGRNDRKTALLHRIVYEAFVGPIPAEMEIHHKDGDRHNNCISNLQCLTKSIHHGITPNNVSGMVKFNTEIKIKEVEQWTLDGKHIATFKGFKAASQATGICERNIAQVANQEEYKPGKVRKQAGGYIWKLRK